MERRRGWELLGLTTGAFFVTMVARLVPNPLVPDVLRTVAVTKAEVGLALSGMWAAYAFFQFRQSFASFFPIFLVEHARLGEARPSLLFGGVFAVTVAGAPALGRVSDATGRDPVLAASLSAGAAGYAVFLFAGGPAALAAGVLLVGAGPSWTGVPNSRFMDALAPGEPGSGWCGRWCCSSARSAASCGDPAVRLAGGPRAGRRPALAAGRAAGREQGAEIRRLNGRLVRATGFPGVAGQPPPLAALTTATGGGFRGRDRCSNEVPRIHASHSSGFVS